jgi:hypothetical protein
MQEWKDHRNSQLRMKTLRLIWYYLRKLRAGEYLVHRTDEGLLMEIKSTHGAYTFRKNGVVLGSYTYEIEIAEANAQALHFAVMKTACTTCGFVPFKLVSKNGVLGQIICEHQLSKQPRQK